MTAPEEPMDWDDLVTRLTSGTGEDPNAEPPEEPQKPKVTSVWVKRLTMALIQLGRSFTTAIYVAVGALGLMWFNLGLAETFPAMPPGISFYNAFFVFGGAVLAWSIFKRLANVK